MTWPLIALAFLSLIGGFLSVPHWLSPMFPLPQNEHMVPMVVSATFGIAGIGVAALAYLVNPQLADSLKAAAGPLYALVLNKYYVDELYSAVIVKPLIGISRILLWKGVDEGLIDSGLVNGFGRVLRGWGSLLRQLQSGSIRNYATWILAGSLIVIFAFGLFGVGK